MATVTAQELERARQDMLREGYSPDEVDKSIEPFVAQLESERFGVPESSQPMPPASAPLTATTRAARFLAPVAGGIAGRALAQQLAPRLGMFGRVTSGMAGSTVGDIAGRTIAGEEQNFPQSAAIGLAGGVGDIAMETATRGAALLGGVPQRAVSESMRRGPVGAGRFVKKPGEMAEMQQAEAAQARSAELMSPQRSPLPSMQTARGSINRFDAAIGRVDKKPILDKIDDILAKRTPEASVEEAAANRSLNRQRDIIARFPINSLDDMEGMLQRIREPVAAQLGKTGAPTHKGDIIQIQRFVREYRDELLTRAGLPEGPAAFKLASKQIESIKRFRDMIVDESGYLKPNAETTWRNALSKENHAVAKVMKEYDKMLGENVYERARELALRREWTPQDETTAVFLWSLIARAARRTMRGAARAGVTAGQFAGPLTSGAAAAFQQEMERGRRLPNP